MQKRNKSRKYDHLEHLIQIDEEFSYLLEEYTGYIIKAGTGHNKFYVRLRIDKNSVLLHRAIMEAAMCMVLPQKLDIDHADGDGLNNKLSNLRIATRSENVKNGKLRTDNTTGVTGVYWHKRDKVWQAVISVNGKSKTLGYFAAFDDAVDARKKAEVEHYGDFIPCRS